MKKELFILLRHIFNNLNLDLQPQHKLDEQGLDALKKTMALFNKEFDTLTVEDFKEVADALEDYQEKFQLVGGIFDKVKLN